MGVLKDSDDVHQLSDWEFLRIDLRNAKTIWKVGRNYPNSRFKGQRIGIPGSMLEWNYVNLWFSFSNFKIKNCMNTGQKNK